MHTETTYQEVGYLSTTVNSQKWNTHRSTDTFPKTV